MTNRERFQALMHFQPVDRLPIVEWASWWNETLDRWHGEGLDAHSSGQDAGTCCGGEDERWLVLHGYQDS